MKTYTLGELASHVGGQVVGDKNIAIHSVAGLRQAGEGEISFLANPKYSRQVKTTGASAVIVKEPMTSNAAMLVCSDPYYAFMQITVLLHGHRRHPVSGVSERAAIASSARVGQGTSIGDFACLSENVRIGANCTLYPGVFIGPDTVNTLPDATIDAYTYHVDKFCQFFGCYLIFHDLMIGGKNHPVNHISKIIEIIFKRARLNFRCTHLYIHILLA